jgi:hypothetical protein
MDILTPSLLGSIGLLCGCAFPISGIVFGLAQWRFLRGPKHDLRLWLVTNTIGWTVSLFIMSVMFGILTAVFNSGQLVLIVATPLVGGLAGLIAGSITGWGLMRVLKTPVIP